MEITHKDREAIVRAEVYEAVFKTIEENIERWEENERDAPGPIVADRFKHGVVALSSIRHQLRLQQKERENE